MTAQAVADLLHARPAGHGKWRARCPAHDDAHPSLSVTQGHSGVLLRCWSRGCDPEAITAALGLTVRHLFSDADTTPQQRREATRRTSQRELERKAEHHAGCQRNAELYRLECLANQLGGLLCRKPDDGEVARLFDSILAKLRGLETASNAPEDGSIRCQPMLEIPSWIADDLHQIGGNFHA